MVIPPLRVIFAPYIMLYHSYNSLNKLYCQGDSGSPAVFQEATNQRYVLKGVVSGGLRCGTLDYPNIFVRYFIRNWLPHILHIIFNPGH